MTVTRCARPSRVDAVEHRGEKLGLVLAADERGGGTRQRGARDGDPDGLPCGHGLGLALEVRGSSSVYSIEARVRRWVASPTVTEPGRAAD